MHLCKDPRFRSSCVDHFQSFLALKPGAHGLEGHTTQANYSLLPVVVCSRQQLVVYTSQWCMWESGVL